MADAFVIRRHSRRDSPMRSRRVGAQLYAGVGAESSAEFPGTEVADATSKRGRLLSSGVSLLIHGAFLGALFLTAALTPEEEIEKIFKLKRIEDAIAKEEPAPAPRVIAEARAVYDPSPMALAPQVVSPAVVTQAAPLLAAQKLEMETLSTVRAPREVEGAARVVEQARTYQSQIQVTASPLAVDAQAPAIRGPIEHVAPSEIQAGPRQIVSTGSTVGIADPQALGTGSSVREGIASNRDVHGAKTGARAHVNWAVGDSNMRGTGGSGTGPGGTSWEECLTRPEVQAYMARIKSRVLARWTLPAEVQSNQAVKLRFVLDPAGTASRVGIAESSDGRLGESAVSALRSASPFDHMPDRVRCLAGEPIIATFRNPTVAAN